MGEQAEELERVSARISAAVFAFLERIGVAGSFHAEALRDWVVSEIRVAPSSADRILRDLRARGSIDYKVLNRRQSLYYILHLGAPTTMTTSATTTLPVFTESLADCASCELKASCAKGDLAYAYRPTNFNGIMLIGEGAVRQDVLKHRPFSGQDGKLLAELCSRAGFNLDDCYITNATLCKPDRPTKKSFQLEFPNAVTSCLSRLEAEVRAVRPTVIVTLGSAAWAAVSGYDVEQSKRVELHCERCQDTREIGPVLQCSAPVLSDDGTTSRPCHYLHFLRPGATDEQRGIEVDLLKARGCEGCGAKMKRLRPKMAKCPVCGGRKTSQVTSLAFVTDYTVTDVAGALFVPGEPGPRAAHELHPWLAEAGVKFVMPTFHPSYILHGQTFAAGPVAAHLRKAHRFAQVGAKAVAYTYCETSDPAVLRDWMSGRTQVAADIETIGRLDPEDPKLRLDARHVRNVETITCIGFADGEDALVVDTRNVDPKNPDDRLLEALFDVLTNDKICKTYHNGAGYDLLVIDLVWGISVDYMLPSYTDDTMYAHINLFPDVPHDLSAVTCEMADAFAWKPPRVKRGSNVHENFSELAAYNARDVVHTSKASRAMGILYGKAIPGGMMDRAGLADVYEVDGVIRKAAVQMTMRGMPLDAAGWAKAGDVARGHIRAAEERIAAVIQKRDYGPFNPRSTKDVIDLLHNSTKGFRLPVLKTTNQFSKTPATDASTLLKLTTLQPAIDPLAMEFLVAKRELLAHDYVASNFVFSPKMAPWADGRIHPVWKPWGAKTGRWTSSPNAQNWPKWLRALIRASKGRKIVGADYDQLELRNLALLASDHELARRCLEADGNRKLEPDYDPHSYVANMAFASRYSSLSLKDPAHVKDVKKCLCETCTRKALRELTKRVIYGLNYGAGEATIIESIYNAGYDGPPITVDMVRLVKRTVFTAFDRIEPWQRNQILVANETGELRSPMLNRRRVFPLAVAPPAVREDVPTTEVKNFPIQAMGADIINTQMVTVLERLPDVDPSAFLIAQVHDALYVEASEDRAEAVAQLLTDTLTVSHEFNGLTMHFTATGSVADTWKDA
jgi:uracil-DNA glycosylase family 4